MNWFATSMNLKRPIGIEFYNIHYEPTLADLFADKDLNDDDSNTFDNYWGLNNNPEEDLQKITFDSFRLRRLYFR